MNCCGAPCKHVQTHVHMHTALELSQATAHISKADRPGWGGTFAPPRRRRVVAAGDGGQLDGVRPWGCFRQQADLLAGALQSNSQAQTARELSATSCHLLKLKLRL